MAVFRTRRWSRSHRRRRRLYLLWLAPVCILAALAAYVAQDRTAQPHRDVSRPTGVTVAPALKRPVYPYSIIPGGIYTVDELSHAVGRDPLVSSHYRGFDLPRAHTQQLAQSRMAYVSYRRHDAVYWTRRPLLLKRGETVLSDGSNLIRARCGNRISDSPQSPVAADEPSADAWDVTGESDSSTTPPTPLIAEGGNWPHHGSVPASSPGPPWLPAGVSPPGSNPRPTRPGGSPYAPPNPLPVLPPGSRSTPPNPTRTLPPGSPTLPPDPAPTLPPGSPTPTPTPLPALTPTSPTPTSPTPTSPTPAPTPTPSPTPPPLPASPAPKPPSPLLPNLPPLHNPPAYPFPVPGPNPFDDPPPPPSPPSGPSDPPPTTDQLPVPAVPEPSSILLFGSAALIALWRLNHRKPR